MDAHLKAALAIAASAWSLTPHGASAALATEPFHSASGLIDPTVPPAPAQAEPAPSAETPEAAPMQQALRLQMIFRGPGKRRSALIGGKIVRAGDHLDALGGQSRVIRITNSSVVLVHADSKVETLALTPQTTEAIRCTRNLAVKRTGPTKTVSCSATAYGDPSP